MAMQSKFLLRLDFPNWASVKENTASAVQEAQKQLRLAVQAGGRILVRYLKEYAPVGIHYNLDGSTYTTENLRNSIRWSTYLREELAGGVGGFTVPQIYGPLVPEGVRLQITMALYGRYTLPPGTRPHIILPKYASHLVFYWAKLGKVMYLKRVNHPGYKGDNWDEKAYQAARAELEHAVDMIGSSWRIFSRRKH